MYVTLHAFEYSTILLISKFFFSVSNFFIEKTQKRRQGIALDHKRLNQIQIQNTTMEKKKLAQTGNKESTALYIPHFLNPMPFSGILITQELRQALTSTLIDLISLTMCNGKRGFIHVGDPN